MAVVSLDVGCGPVKTFDVRIDLNRDFKPTVICDAQYLPFKSKVFSLVNCSHLLEHLDRPCLCLIEINRVAKPDAKILVGFPLEKNASNTMCYLRILLYNLFMPSLPLIILGLFRGLNEIRTKSYTAYHKWIITPEYVSKSLRIEKLEKHGSYWQTLLVGKKAKLLGIIAITLKQIGPPHSYSLTCKPRFEGDPPKYSPLRNIEHDQSVGEYVL